MQRRHVETIGIRQSGNDRAKQDREIQIQPITTTAESRTVGHNCISCPTKARIPYTRYSADAKQVNCAFCDTSMEVCTPLV